MPEYSDDEFLDAVTGRTTTHAVAEKVGCAQKTAHRRLYDLACEQKVAFETPPLMRTSRSEAIVLPMSDTIDSLYEPPEEWPEPIDER